MKSSLGVKWGGALLALSMSVACGGSDGDAAESGSETGGSETGGGDSGGSATGGLGGGDTGGGDTGGAKTGGNGGGAAGGAATGGLGGDATGGLGGGDTGGTGGSQNCVHDAECVGRSSGDGICLAGVPSTCVDEDGDGCLDAVAGEACDSGICGEVDGVAACRGNSCAAPAVAVDGLVLAGDDFDLAFTDEQDFGGSNCVGTLSNTNEAVFSVELEANQTLHVTEEGGLDAVIGFAKSCDDGAACVASEDFTDTVSYTSSTAETVFVWVAAYGSSQPRDYDIHFVVSTCGDGEREGGEKCDDGNAVPGDGCSACAVEPRFSCTKASPSVCTGPIDLGTYAAGDLIPEESHGSMLEGESQWYEITFTDTVNLSGFLDCESGDPDLFVYNEDGDTLVSENGIGNPGFTDILDAGTYTIEVRAYDDIGPFVLSLATDPSLGSFGVGDTLTNNGGSLGAGLRVTYSFVLENDALVSGTLTAPSGDPDFYIKSASGNVLSSVASGNEAFAEELTAGSYILEVHAFGNDALSSYSLNLSFASP